MGKLDKILKAMSESPQNIRFAELVLICEYYFGEARQKGTSHCVFRTPWRGDPRVNIQNHNGKAKPYQVRQVLSAIKKMNTVPKGAQ